MKTFTLKFTASPRRLTLKGKRQLGVVLLGSPVGATALVE